MPATSTNGLRELKIRMGRIKRYISEKESQTLLIGEYEKLNSIWYDLLETFPYDVRDSSNEYWKQTTHNISMEELI